MSDQKQLVATAIGAAVAGAALGVAAMKVMDSKSKKEEDAHSQFVPLVRRNSRTQLIYEEPDGTRSVVFPHNHEEKMRRQIAARHAIEEDNILARNSVTVRVPATSANMGPGCTSEYTKPP